MIPLTYKNLSNYVLYKKVLIAYSGCFVSYFLCQQIRKTKSINVKTVSIKWAQISFAGKNGLVIISLSSTSNYLTISISDNGPGIKEPNIERIFDRFYSLREEDQLSAMVHSGLGLNIAKQIIDSHGGYISANNISEDNIISGARFIINLPLGN